MTTGLAAARWLSSPAVLATVAVLLALALDLAVAEFPERVHPVALFGRLVAPLDREWPAPRAVGALAALALPLLAAGLVAVLAWGAGRVHPGAAALVAGVALFATTSLRMLLDVAREVIAATGEDLDAARTDLRALAGRDASALSAGEVRSAAVESAAENLADGLVAPLAAFALGATLGLPAAAAAATWIKAVNTMDSMLGYRTKPVGWAAARLDDAVVFLPARLSAGLLAVAAVDPWAPWRARRDAREPLSPNSGWPMGTLARVLDVRLEKPGVYALNATAALPDRAAAERGVRAVGVAGGLAYLLAAGATAVGAGALVGRVAGVVPWS